MTEHKLAQTKKITEQQYIDCIKILNEELKPAMGCTEPIAIAYGAAIARETLGKIPDSIIVEASGNIIKNVKSVVVPNTNNLRGIPSAVAAGVIVGNSKLQLEVISSATEEQRLQIEQYVNNTPIKVNLSDSPLIFNIEITALHGEDCVKVQIAKFHTNVVKIEHNGKILAKQEIKSDTDDDNNLTKRDFLSVELIYEFANSVKIEDIKELLDKQISYNMAIAQSGLDGEYGANIGNVLLKSNPIARQCKTDEGIKLLALARAAAGSDARMNGCELPVIINSGSGNQGITVSVPVITYAQELNVSSDKMYRALVISNLISIHIKTRIGRLSAFCGAISAGAAAACGIAYVKNKTLKVIEHTIVNALAISSGVICDGAKASCAGKIVLAVNTGILGLEMYCEGEQFSAGDGIVVQKGVESLIANVGRLGFNGMQETDKEILSMMTECM